MAEPRVGNGDLNNSVGAITGLLGIVPGLSPLASLINGGVGVASGINGRGTGNNQLDEDVNNAGIASGIIGSLGPIANMLGVTTGIEIGGLTSIAGAGGSAAATTATGAAIGGASAAAGVIGAGAAGYGYGNMFNSFVQRNGLAGTGSDGRARSLSDMAGDHGWAAHEAVAHFFGGENPGTAADIAGHVAGLGTVMGESVLGTAAAVASAPLVIADTIGSGIAGLFR